MHTAYIEAAGKKVIAEVKDLDENANSQAIRAETENSGIVVGNVDLDNTSVWDSKLSKQAKQLAESSTNGYPTVGVLYDKQFFGPVSISLETMMKMGRVAIPNELSAVILLDGPGVRSGESAGGNGYKIFRNSDANIELPANIFPST